MQKILNAETCIEISVVPSLPALPQKKHRTTKRLTQTLPDKTWAGDAVFLSWAGASSPQSGSHLLLKRNKSTARTILRSAGEKKASSRSSLLAMGLEIWLAANPVLPTASRNARAVAPRESRRSHTLTLKHNAQRTQLQPECDAKPKICTRRDLPVWRCQGA